MRHLASHLTRMAREAPASDDDQDTLYHLEFVGGPFDGHEASWRVLPAPCLKLYSGAAAEHAMETRSATAPRGVRYQLESTELCPAKPEPYVILRYAHCGLSIGPLRSRSPWNRCLLWVRRLWSGAKSQPAARTRN
jgi:hypothetical protein